MWAIVIGVVAGALANLLTNVFVTVWLPAYRDYIYRGVRIDGDWVVENVDLPIDGDGFADTWQLSARLHQKAYRITGTAAAHRSVTGRKQSIDAIHYTIDGSIADRFVMLQMRPQDKTRIAHSSFHMEVLGDGNRMAGYRCFYGLLMDEIRSIRSSWHRYGPTHALPLESVQSVGEDAPKDETRKVEEPGAAV